MNVLKTTDYKNLGKLKHGKVRDIYEQDDKIIFITTDRLTGFDRLLATIPHKGAVLNLTSAFWFKETEDIIPNHVLDVPDPNVTVGKKCVPEKIEAVVRGYLTGSTDTSIWTRYSKGLRSFGDIQLPDGMKKNEPLPHPIFDPTTKEDLHDRTLSQEELIAEGFVTAERFEEIKEKALALFKRGQEVAKKRGRILVDTKYEFGVDENGVLTLIDEIHTPDSSRYWEFVSYEERLAKGEEPMAFDKEFIRLWFKANSDPYKDEVLPEAPADLVAELSRRYISIYEQLTGEKFVIDESVPLLERIDKNLERYRL